MRSSKGSIKADMAKRYPHTLARGRHSTPVEVILRMLIVRRLYDWSYEQTEHFVSDSLVLRQFCRLYLQPVPDDTTLIRWANLVGADTLTEVNHRVVKLATQLKVTRGRKLANCAWTAPAWTAPAPLCRLTSITRQTVPSSVMEFACSAGCCTKPKSCWTK